MQNTVEPSSEMQVASKTSDADSLVSGVTIENGVRTQWTTSLGDYLKKLPPLQVRRKHVIDTKFEKDAKCPQFVNQQKYLFVLDSMGTFPDCAPPELPKVVFKPTPRTKLRRKMEAHARR